MKLQGKHPSGFYPEVKLTQVTSDWPSAIKVLEKGEQRYPKFEACPTI
jgi:hypothetical protein